jgi:hypothetical protein
MEFPAPRNSTSGITTPLKSIFENLRSGRSDHKRRCKMLRDTFESLDETYSQLLATYGLHISARSFSILNREDVVGLSVEWRTTNAESYGYDYGCWHVETTPFWAGVKNTECRPQLMGHSGITSTFRSRDFGMNLTTNVVDFVNSYVLALMMELDLVGEDAT